jgi:hypothetical protein
VKILQMIRSSEADPDPVQLFRYLTNFDVGYRKILVPFRNVRQILSPQSDFGQSDRGSVVGPIFHITYIGIIANLWN